MKCRSCEYDYGHWCEDEDCSCEEPGCPEEREFMKEVSSS